MKKTTLLLCLFLPYFLSACSLGYVVKQGVFQMKLLTMAEPIEHALRSPKLPSDQRAKLMLIQNVRQFCEQNLKLVVNKNYRNVSLAWNYKVYNISASEALEFKPFLWWFPIIGHVPYKGFFVQDDAQKERDRLQAQGYDTLMGSVGGYSTLGYFSDPVWPSMLQYSDDHLVELIIHELAHSTLYFANQTVFNESFANFVGKKGAELFFENKYGKNSEFLKEMAHNNEYEAISHQFFSQLHDELDRNYSSNNSRQIKLEQKNIIIDRSQKAFKSLPIPETYKSLDWTKVNNAYLLSFKRYNYDEKVFQDIFTLMQNDFSKFLAFVKYHGNASDPFLALRDAVEYAQRSSHR